MSSEHTAAKPQPTTAEGDREIREIRERTNRVKSVFRVFGVFRGSIFLPRIFAGGNQEPKSEQLRNGPNTRK